MNRRNFLQTTTAAAAATSTALNSGVLHSADASPRTDAVARPSRIMKACKYSMVKEPDLNTVDTFKMLKDIGFGLRLSPSRSSGKSIVHLDVAFPLDGDDTIDNVQWLVTTKKSL